MVKSNWNIDNIANQAGRVFVITGSTSGLGKEATKVLAGKNANVVMRIRNPNGNKSFRDFCLDRTFIASVEKD